MRVKFKRITYIFIAAITFITTLHLGGSGDVVQAAPNVNMPGAIWYSNSNDVGFWPNNVHNAVVVYANRRTTNPNGHLHQFVDRINEANQVWRTALGINIVRTTNRSIANIIAYAGTRNEMRAILGAVGTTYWGFGAFNGPLHARVNIAGRERLVTRITTATAVHVDMPGMTLLQARQLVAHELGHTLGYDGHPTSGNVNNIMTQSSLGQGGLVVQPNEARHLRQIYNLFKRGAAVVYRAHVETTGWQGWQGCGQTGGTAGQRRQMEALQLQLHLHGIQGGIRYRAHVETIGWQPWVANGATAGTAGQARRMEAIQIELTGTVATRFHVEYRAHVENIGWQPWVRNGATAGTTGQWLQMEAIQIRLIPR